MASQIATGAIHVYLKPPGESIEYFGTCESMPQDSRQPEYEMLMNDMTGSKVPLDVAFEAQSAQISLVMTRPKQTLVEKLVDVPYSLAPAGGSYPGTWTMYDVGSLIAAENLSWQCYLVYSFGAQLGNKAVYVGQGLRPGRHYVQCVLWAPQSDEAGTKPMKQHFMLYAWPKFMPGNPPYFTLYDYDMTGCTAAMIV